MKLFPALRPLIAIAARAPGHLSRFGERSAAARLVDLLGRRGFTDIQAEQGDVEPLLREKRTADEAYAEYLEARPWA